MALVQGLGHHDRDMLAVVLTSMPCSSGPCTVCGWPFLRYDGFSAFSGVMIAITPGYRFALQQDRNRYLSLRRSGVSTRTACERARYPEFSRIACRPSHFQPAVNAVDLVPTERPCDVSPQAMPGLQCAQHGTLRSKVSLNPFGSPA